MFNGLTLLVGIICFCGGFGIALMVAAFQSERDYEEIAEFIREQERKDLRAREKRLIEQTNRRSIKKAKEKDYFGSF